MKHATIRVRGYLLIAFLLSFFLFYVSAQQGPQGELIDLDSYQLRLRYTALFFFLNMMTILAGLCWLSFCFCFGHGAPGDQLRPKQSADTDGEDGCHLRRFMAVYSSLPLQSALYGISALSMGRWSGLQY